MDTMDDHTVQKTYTMIEDGLAMTCHTINPYEGFRFGATFDENGDIDVQQFERYGKRVRLHRDGSDFLVEGV